MADVQMEHVESSNIEEMGYDPYELAAYVRFKSGGTYKVLGMKADAWDLWRNHPEEGSYGKHYSRHIKGKYEAVRVS